jgi:hypothetical protein
MRERGLQLLLTRRSAGPHGVPQEAVPGGNFTSRPAGPIRVLGDSVRVVYNAGFQGKRSCGWRCLVHP